MEKAKYFWKHSKGEIFIAFLVTMIALFVVGRSNNNSPFSMDDMQCWYSDWIDPVITIATLLVAIFVWVDSQLREWRNSLPKKLNVHFLYDGQYILSCYNANLVGEHDIRALGQQIGAQMNGSNLNFYPIVSSVPPQIKKYNKSKSYLSYEVSFTLKEVPSKFEKDYLVWLVDKENLHKVDSKTIDGHPTSPYLLQNDAK